MVRTKNTPRFQPNQRVVCARASPQLRRAQCSQPSGVRKRICAPSTSIITPRETMQAHAREELRRLQEEEAEAQLEKPGEQLSAVPVKAACGPGGDHTTHHIPAVQGLPVVKALPVVRAVAVPVAVLVAEPAEIAADLEPAAAAAPEEGPLNFQDLPQADRAAHLRRIEQEREAERAAQARQRDLLGEIDALLSLRPPSSRDL